MKQILSRTLQTGAGIVLIVLLVIYVDWSQVFQTWRRIPLSMALATCGIVAIALALVGVRLYILLRFAGLKHTLSMALRTTYTGAACSLVLPGQIGEDVARFALLRSGAPGVQRRVVGVLLADRVLGALALAAITLLGLYAVPESISLPKNTLLFAVAAGTVAMGIACLWWKKRGQIQFRQSATFQSLVNTKSRRHIAMAIVLSLIAQCIDIATYWVIGLGIGIHQLGYIEYFAIIPWIYWLMVIPASIGGLGLREGAMALLLSAYGVPATLAIALSLAVYVIRASTSLCAAGLLFVGNGWGKLKNMQEQRSAA